MDKPFGFACICPKANFGNRCQFKRRRKTTTRQSITSTQKFALNNNNITTSSSLHNSISTSIISTTNTSRNASFSKFSSKSNQLATSGLSDDGGSLGRSSISFETRVAAANSIVGSTSCSKEFACENRGVCLETMNGFQCQCLPRFTGVHCELPLK